MRVISGLTYNNYKKSVKSVKTIISSNLISKNYLVTGEEC